MMQAAHSPDAPMLQGRHKRIGPFDRRLERVSVIGREGSREREIMHEVGIAARIVYAVRQRGVISLVEGIVQMQINTLTARAVDENSPAKVRNRVIAIPVAAVAGAKRL